jgi:hypothetical protein
MMSRACEQEDLTSFAVYALSINGVSQLRDPRDDGTECTIRTTSIDLLSYDADADTVTITLRNGTTLEVAGRQREAYEECTNWVFGDIGYAPDSRPTRPVAP